MQKDLVIMNQSIAINALSDQVSLLKQQYLNTSGDMYIKKQEIFVFLKIR